MSTDTRFDPFNMAEEIIEQNVVELDNYKKIQLCVVPCLHPTMLEACGEFDDISGPEVYGILRSLDVFRVLLTETEPIRIAVEFQLNRDGYEEQPLYYLIPWSEWSEFLNYYCKNMMEEVVLDWRIYGF
tara:strand:+ start:43 stop:429 length:387 start_codon:yes stop_codon:yes gene_type:complete